MKKTILFIIVLSLSFAFLSSGDADAAIMEDYCQVPPYVIQNVAPNVMIVLDNSGSMFNFAYYDGYTTPTTADDNLCSSSGSPCTGFATPGAYPNYEFYGYYDPDLWYEYSNNRFQPTAPKTGSGLSGERAKNSDEWDGNFLNWVTMRRIDVIRRVLTGGKGNGGRLKSENADCDNRGRFKQITNIENYADSTSYSGTRCLRVLTAAGSCGGGGSGTPEFEVSSTSSCTSTYSTGYSVDIEAPTPFTGVLQEVVGTRARIGLSFYNVNAPTPQGGEVRVTIGGGSLSSTVNEINNSRPNSNTPLAETLWTMAGYYAQATTIVGSPGPRYNTGDYQINDNDDPMNYGTGGQARYPSCAKNYVLYLTDGEPCADGYLPTTIKSYANGKSDFDCYDLSPGSPGRDGYCPAVSATLPGETFSFPASTLPSCNGGGEGGYVSGIEDVALWMHTTDLRDTGDEVNLPSENWIEGIQNLNLYTVFAFGKGSTLLRYAAINGGFEDSNGNNEPDLQSEWDANGDNEPDTFYEATDGAELEEKLREAFADILKRASSGTAASVLASGEGQGANLVQAIFYPRRAFGNDVILWTGVAQNMWYYVDPLFLNSSIRGDTVQDFMLNLKDDYIVSLYFDSTPTVMRTKALLCSDDDGDGDCDTVQGSVFLEDLQVLWEASGLLWDRDVTAAATKRKIYTTIDGSNFLAGNFSSNALNGDSDNSAVLAPFLQAIDINGDGSNVDEAAYIIRYATGEGLTTEDLDGDGLPDVTGVDLDSDGVDDYRSRTVTIGSNTKVWKLGDILNSTPRISSWIQLNTYDDKYGDTTYEDYLNTSSSCSVTTAQSCAVDTDCPFTETCVNNPEAYKNRGMVFTGGNDGMLHAFKLGRLEFPSDPAACNFPIPSSPDVQDKACLSGTDFGKEMWAFIPKNALPYLKYKADPEYCHIYDVDLSPYIFDASIGTGGGCAQSDYADCLKSGATVTKPQDRWRTILIGGMRTGGACRATTTVCVDVSGDGSKDCVNTPVDVAGESVGYSSYFALDITDESNPQFLWEFSHDELGYATTGPSVIRIAKKQTDTNGDGFLDGKDATDNSKNGRWVVVFGSGPTGPIDTTENQFMGRSDQNLKLFIFDLANGPGANNADVTVKDTGIPYAFAGSMLNVTNDPDLDYQDDVLYVTYVKRIGTGTGLDPYRWTDGGVLRLVTREDVSIPVGVNWQVSTLIDGIGANTSSITRLQNDKEGLLWLFFGTGRWYNVIDGVSDDPDSQRTLFGIKEPCFSTTGYDETCTTTVDPGTLTNVSAIGDVPTEVTANALAFKGWYIYLDLSGSYTYGTDTSNFLAERVITDPTSTTTGLVFFATYKPYSDECGLGGKTFIWALRYNTGGAGGAALKGKVVIQVSTAAIEQLDLSTAFTERGGRRTSAMEGVPPTSQGMSILTPPPPIEKTIHIRER